MFDLPISGDDLWTALQQTIEMVAVACAPFFGPALRRSAAVSTVVM